MCQALPGSKYYGGSAPSWTARRSVRPADPSALDMRRQDQDGSRVHCDFARRRRSPTRSLRPHHGYPAALHRGLPASRQRPAQEFPPEIGWDAPLSAHIHQVRADPDLRDVNAGSSRTPFHPARRTRTIWQCWRVPTLSGPLATLSGTTRIELPELHRPAATESAEEVSHLLSNSQRLTAHSATPEN